jgi:hypothetical protein
MPVWARVPLLVLALALGAWSTIGAVEGVVETIRPTASVRVALLSLGAQTAAMDKATITREADQALDLAGLGHALKTVAKFVGTPKDGWLVAELLRPSASTAERNDDDLPRGALRALHTRFSETWGVDVDSWTPDRYAGQGALGWFYVGSALVYLIPCLVVTCLLWGQQWWRQPWRPRGMSPWAWVPLVLFVVPVGLYTGAEVVWSFTAPNVLDVAPVANVALSLGADTEGQSQAAINRQVQGALNQGGFSRLLRSEPTFEDRERLGWVVNLALSGKPVKSSEEAPGLVARMVRAIAVPFPEARETRLSMMFESSPAGRTTGIYYLRGADFAVCLSAFCALLLAGVRRKRNRAAKGNL